MQRTLLAILISLVSMPGIPQNSSGEGSVRYGYLQVLYHTGTTWSRTEYLSEQFDSGYRGLEMRLGFQATGKRAWELFHHYPKFGVGISYTDAIRDPNDTTLANPISGFAFLSAPWIRLGRITLYSDVAIGLSYSAFYYDPVSNPYNDVIGSHLNLHFSYNLNLGYVLSKRIDLYAGGGLTHHSNGAIQSPQKGLNNWGLNLGLSYHFRYPEKGGGITGRAGDFRPDLIYFEIPDSLPGNEIQIMAAAGVVDIHDLGIAEGAHYFTSSLTADYSVPLTLKNRVTFGLDFLYDSSLELAIKGVPPENVTTFQKTYLGSHMGYQILIDRITLLFNFGTYFLHHSMDRGFWFMRAGGRIGITNHIHAHICIKTKAGIRADWIEWGMAYHIDTL